MSSFKPARFAALLAILLIITGSTIAAGASDRAAGDALILGNTSQSAGTKNTAFKTNTTGNAFRVNQNGTGSALRGVAGDGNGGNFTAENANGNGIFSENTGGSTGTGTGLTVEGNRNTGIYATSEGPTGTYAVRGVSSANIGGAFDGVYGGGYGIGTGLYGWGGQNDSPSAFGLWGIAESPSGYAGYMAGNLYVSGDSTFVGAKTGYVAEYAVNGSLATLHQGDAVSIMGVRPPIVGNIPLLVVGPARVGDRVIGVVDRAMAPSTVTRTTPAGKSERSTTYYAVGTRVQKGQYFLVVTFGSFAHGSVDASAGPIRAGDSLAAGATQGELALAPTVLSGNYSYAVPGLSVGYALGSLSSGKGTIAIFVSPH
jgi:hypothetical protein